MRRERRQGLCHLLQVEKLLAEISAMESSSAMNRPDSAGGSPLEARVRIFERLASEVARLNFYTARGKASILAAAIWLVKFSLTHTDPCARSKGMLCPLILRHSRVTATGSAMFLAGASVCAATGASHKGRRWKAAGAPLPRAGAGPERGECSCVYTLPAGLCCNW